METCWQGTANAWECDEMGHLNVRHYLDRAEDALAILLASHAIPPRAVTTQHIRYHRETRAGTPLRIDGGFTRAGTTPQAYFEFISPYDGVLRATLIADLADGRPVAPPCLALPARGAPRGLQPAAPAGGASLAAAAEAGLMEIYRGLVHREQTDPAGMLRPHQVIGIISDGVAHLMMHITPGRAEGPLTGGIGGAALEQRLHFLALPRIGDILTVRSGVISAEAKTMRFVHWLLNAHTGEICATCEVVAVAFDLTTRRAVAVTDAVRARVSELAVQVSA